MDFVNKGTDPVHRRLDFLDKAVGNGSLHHFASCIEVPFAITVYFLILYVCHSVRQKQNLCGSLTYTD